MKNGRNQRDVLSIERTLGLKSERGISRQSNKDAPPVEAALKGIKLIQTAYVQKSLEQIRESQALKDDAGGLFDKYAPQIWPGPEEESPLWLEEPSEARHDGRYSKRLHHTDAEERETLRNAFIELVIEKCINYHENQLQKSRRQTAKQLNQQLQETYDDTEDPLHNSIYTQPENSIFKEDEPDQDSGIGASPPEQPRLSEKTRTFQEQFAAYTSPVPFTPHGLPSVTHGLPLMGGVYPRPSSSRRSSSAVTHHHLSQKRLPGQTPPAPPSKRARIVREDGTRADSLVVKLKVGPAKLSHFAETGSIWANRKSPSSVPSVRHMEQATMHVDTRRAQSTLPSSANSDPYVSPYRQTLPWDGDRSTRQKSGPPQAVHIDLTMEHDEPAPTVPTARDILGEFADYDMIKALLQNHPGISRDRLENIYSVLSEFPDTRTDFFLLEKRTRGLASRTGPPAPTRRLSASQSRNPEVNAKTAAIGRTVKLANEILGPLTTCSAAIEALNSYPLMSREQLELLRSTFFKYPEAQNDFHLLQKFVRFEAWDVVTGAVSFPRKPSADGQQKYMVPATEPKKEQSPEIKKESPAAAVRSLNSIAVEINWGRDLEYADYMDLQDFETVHELFEQIDSYLPDELQDDDQKIKEVRVKSKTDLNGGNIQLRIVRDENRGKAALRYMIKKLRAQPPELEIELIFSVHWDKAA